MPSQKRAASNQKVSREGKRVEAAASRAIDVLAEPMTVAEEKVVVTPFQQSVYDCISKIPAGCVSTYKLVAKALGCGSMQAVGQALRRNPFAPRVPCHRVIAADLRIGGFCGCADVQSEQLRRKRRLLEEEGVLFDAEFRLCDPSRVYDVSLAS